MITPSYIAMLATLGQQADGAAASRVSGGIAANSMQGYLKTVGGANGGGLSSSFF